MMGGHLSLRAQIIGVTGLAMLCLQVTTVVLLLDERYFTSQIQQVDDALFQFANVAVTLEETPDYLHDTVIQANTNNQQIFSLSVSPVLTAADDSGWSAAFEETYFDSLERTGFLTSAPIISIKRVSENLQKKSEKSWAQDVISIEAQMSQGNYLYAQFAQPPVSINLQWRLLGLLFVGLLSIAGLLLLMTVALTRPLNQLTRAARAFGLGQKAISIKETGGADIRQAAAAFNLMQDKLVEALQNQKNTLAAIGHDLRTPLTSLRVRAETLPDSPKRDKIIAKIEELAAMLEAILRFAKLQSDPAALSKQPVRLTSLVSALCSDYQSSEKECSFKVNNEPPELFIDTLNMRRALGNIIDNGLFFGSKVTVTLDIAGSHATITVQDNGPGVPAEKLAQLTKPFFRTENSRNADSGGIGMGLALAKQIIELHHGEIHFQNLENGFHVIISLPTQ
ncbi:HAMP domain-containing histidine kinase [Alphaproteobacteria bacterium]|nr:HAMP domain-containing histidine kinase [Alphaproteobacteria bacterium]MDA8643099.1 HAMP domain-containing histidine kinase [Alphaproteobacteria bacterium]MDA8779868.1 HAMP domain-containing histidine kinase [Alphaproteobacteria bacterium]MDA9591172.1 HAMP domain-containing histidine kinase [Alphaproteobacteria bacterium]MDB2393098.1 HAMP domain-containing histidine kinase [Alphaproteobacteria bacterium]